VGVHIGFAEFVKCGRTVQNQQNAEILLHLPGRSTWVKNFIKKLKNP